MKYLNLYYLSIIGEHEALGCWYLEMQRQKLPYRCRRRCLDLLNHCCSLSPISHQKIERNEGLVKNVLYFYSVRACQQKKEWIKKVWFSTNSFSNPSSKCAITHRHLWCDVCYFVHHPAYITIDPCIAARDVFHTTTLTKWCDPYDLHTICWIAS